MEKITFDEIKFVRAYKYYPMTQAEFIANVALKLMKKVPENEILNYPITCSRADYFEAAQKICEMFNTNNGFNVFYINKKCMSAKQKLYIN